MDITLILQQYAWLLGMFIPWVQGKINEIITTDKKIFGVNITVSEIKAFLSFVISFVLGLGITVVNVLSTGDWDWAKLGAQLSGSYLMSQAIYYGYFKRKDKES